jgi:hypothetical protein
MAMPSRRLLLAMALPVMVLLAGCHQEPYAFRMKIPASANPALPQVLYDFWEDGHVYKTIFDCEKARLELRQLATAWRQGVDIVPAEWSQEEKRFYQSLRGIKHARCVALR